MRLYEIAEQLSSLEFIDKETGVVDLEKLNNLEMAFDEKIENIACYIKNLKAEAAALEVEEKILAERKKAKKNKADSLKDYLENMMSSVGKKKFETARVKISFRSSEGIEVQESDFLAWAQENGRADLLRIKTEISKTAIGKALETEAIPFVDIVERQNIQIK